MPRFFTKNISGGSTLIVGEDARHIARSLRCRIGEELTLCDGNGRDYACRITAIEEEQVTLEVLHSQLSKAEPPVALTLYQALPKGDKLDLIVQKAVELGVTAIVPVITRYCVSRPDEKSMEKKRERLQRIALEAAKQSGRGIIPQVQPLMTYPEALAQMVRDACAILFYEDATHPLGSVLATRPKSISMLIGSEGGLSTEEAQAAKEAGLAVCTMGPRILRCETAPMYALSAITYHYENSEGFSHE